MRPADPAAYSPEQTRLRSHSRGAPQKKAAKKAQNRATTMRQASRSPRGVWMAFSSVPDAAEPGHGRRHVMTMVCARRRRTHDEPAYGATAWGACSGDGTILHVCMVRLRPGQQGRRAQVPQRAGPARAALAGAHLAQLQHHEQPQEGDDGSIGQRLAKLQLVHRAGVIALLALQVGGDVGVQCLRDGSSPSSLGQGWVRQARCTWTACAPPSEHTSQLGSSACWGRGWMRACSSCFGLPLVSCCTPDRQRGAGRGRRTR